MLSVRKMLLKVLTNFHKIIYKTTKIVCLLLWEYFLTRYCTKSNNNTVEIDEDALMKNGKTKGLRFRWEIDLRMLVCNYKVQSATILC